MDLMLSVWEINKATINTAAHTVNKKQQFAKLHW